jgi:hypothetical protein
MLGACVMWSANVRITRLFYCFRPNGLIAFFFVKNCKTNTSHVCTQRLCQRAFRSGLLAKFQQVPKRRVPQ